MIKLPWLWGKAAAPIAVAPDPHSSVKIWYPQRSIVICAILHATITGLCQPLAAAGPRDYATTDIARQPRLTARTNLRSGLSELEANESEQEVPAAPRALGVENVVAEGWGDSEEDALRQAFRRAIRKVLGTIVSEKTATENDILVMNRVVMFSDGFVDSYKVLDTKIEAGKVRQKILATVKKRDLARQLHTERTSSCQDGRGLWPEVVTKIERRKSATALLKACLEEYPWNCLRIETAGTPQTVRTFDNSACIAPRLVLRIDANKFHAAEANLTAALEGLAAASGTVATKSTPAKEPYKSELEKIFRSRFLSASSPAPLGNVSSTIGPVFVFDKAQGWPPKQIASLSDKGGLLFVVGDGRSWHWYLIQEPIDLPRSPKSAWVQFCDDGNLAVVKMSLGLGPIAPGLSVNETTVEGKKLTTIFVSPYFLDHASNGYLVNRLAGCTNISVVGEITISVDDLAKVTNIVSRVEK